MKSSDRLLMYLNSDKLDINLHKFQNVKYENFFSIRPDFPVNATRLHDTKGLNTLRNNSVMSIIIQANVT